MKLDGSPFMLAKLTVVPNADLVRRYVAMLVYDTNVLLAYALDYQGPDLDDGHGHH